ncbi:hypothetical protein RchiOBHm_Chr2g0114951 [Rosa chinensis]|uniref:Uncharacterized protein n=1 Tax=Rosa chinensis TaxID=74649 RepID=A0A2P6RQU9_ROSCH|nr:hypothetical protein RchiOBHm_Chr2g0114951 [Rosa chinensis]
MQLLLASSLSSQSVFFKTCSVDVMTLLDIWMNVSDFNINECVLDVMSF